MTFTFNIPQVGQSLGSSRSQILNNFTNLATTIAVNHGGVNGPNNGKHLQVEMPRQTITPTTLANEGTLYTRLAPVAGVNTDMFYTLDADATKIYQMTRIDLSQFALFGTNVNNYNGVGATLTGGYTFLPGGLLLQYGLVTSPSNNKLVTFPVAYNILPYSIVITPVRPDTQDKVIAIQNGSVSAVSFRMSLSGSDLPNSMYWMAIGF